MTKRDFWLIVATVAYMLIAVKTYWTVSTTYCQDPLWKPEAVGVIQASLWPISVVVNGLGITVAGSNPLDCPKRKENGE